LTSSRAPPDKSSVQVGGRMPAYCTGVGKALLAYQPEPVIREVLAAACASHALQHLYARSLAARTAGGAVDRLAYEREESTIGWSAWPHRIVRNGMVVAAISISSGRTIWRSSSQRSGQVGGAGRVSRTRTREQRLSGCAGSRASVRDPLVQEALSDRAPWRRPLNETDRLVLADRRPDSMVVPTQAPAAARTSPLREARTPRVCAGARSHRH